jgi:hypothetical protein
MFIFDAGRLARAMQYLAETSRLLASSDFAGRFSNLTRQDLYITNLRDIVIYCDELSFPMTKIPVERILRLTADPDFTTAAMADLLGEATRRLRDEAGIHMLLCLSVERVRFYEEPRAGWGEVITRFPDAGSDVEEVSICFALERHAACVFHCVQAIEVGSLLSGT